MFLRSLTTSIWLRKKCNDIFTYQESELAARYLHPDTSSQNLHPDTYFQAVQLSCKCNYSEFGHITVSKLVYVQN